MAKRNKQSNKSLFTSFNLLNMIKKAFKINNNPFPWNKAISAAICAGFPVIVGMLAGKVQFGFLSAIGSFSYLYVFNEPYAQRAKKVLFAAFGLSFSVGLGTLAAPYPVLVIIIVGLIGAIATFIFGLLKIPGPAAVFFVLSFVMTTGMDIDPSLALNRSGLVLAAGLFSWMVSLVGWFSNPHGPEIQAMREVYLSLAAFCKAKDREDNDKLRQRAVNALNASEEILWSGYISWKKSFMFNKLVLLNEQANNLFLEMLELSAHNEVRLPIELTEALKKISKRAELLDKEEVKIDLLPKELKEEYKKIWEIIKNIEDIINNPSLNIEHNMKLLKPSLKMKFNKAFDKDSIVFINAIRYGVVLSISTIVAYVFPFNKSYWIPLSCSAVMLGSTIMATFNRAIQRSCGTIIGLMIATVILMLQPQGYMIIIINMVLTGLTELFIVKNYAVAAIFITSNALLLAETSTKINDIFYFASARIINIVVGSMIGLIGTYIIGHRSASGRLPDLMAKLLHSQSQLIVWLASGKEGNNIQSTKLKLAKEKMEINLMNFKMAYTTALGEIPNNEALLEMLWPAVFSFEQISYLLDQRCMRNRYLNISDKDLAQLLLVFETMVVHIKREVLVTPKKVPILDDMPKICQEINRLQETLSIYQFAVKFIHF